MAKETNTQIANVNSNTDVGFFGMDLDNSRVKEEIVGLGSVNASDLKMPRFKLMQPNSDEVMKNKVKAGWFYNPVTGEQYETLNCRLLTSGKLRVKWKDKFKRGEKPECRSTDGIKSSDGKECAKCIHASWDKKPEGSDRPACNLSYAWLGVTNNEKQDAFRLVVPGKSVSPTKDFITTIISKRVSPYKLSVILSSELTQNDKGSFYVIKYTIAGNIYGDVLNRMGLQPGDIMKANEIEPTMKKLSELKLQSDAVYQEEFNKLGDRQKKSVQYWNEVNELDAFLKNKTLELETLFNQANDIDLTEGASATDPEEEVATVNVASESATYSDGTPKEGALF